MLGVVRATPRLRSPLVLPSEVKGTEVGLQLITPDLDQALSGRITIRVNHHMPAPIPQFALQRHPLRAIALIFGIWTSFALTGCGGEGPYTGSLYPVKGQVLLADGQPLTGGTIQFIPKLGGLRASGTIESDGTFSLKSIGSREGAAPGEYKVRIEPSSNMLAKKARKSPKLPFATKYRELEGNTGLTATIKAEPMQLEPFRLEAG
jgi:hypothetical protein